MDCDNKKNKFGDGLHDQDNDNEEGTDSDNIPQENFSEAIEKMNSSLSESCKAGEKPKGEDDEEEGAKNEKPTTASGIHKCEYCDRTFSSGKALGGHKRCHLQTPRKEAEPNNNNNNNNNKKANCNGKVKSSSCDGKQICSLCNRDFPSVKSLHGHMRKHTDRGWRGIHPPPLPSNKQCSGSIEDNKDDDDDDDHEAATNVSKYLQPSWQKTDKRGRQHVFYCSNEVVKAAQILMHMSQDVWSRDNLNGNGSGSFSESGDERVSANNNNEKEKEEVEAVPPSASGVQDTDEKALMVKKKNKRVKIVVKLKNLYSTSEQVNRHQYETRESSQSGSRTIPDIDLNEPPNDDVPDETN